MLASTLYVRVVPQDKERGFKLLVGYEANLIERTALQYTTLTNPTRASLDAAVERMRLANSAKDVKDVTVPAVQKKLAKLFGEYNPVAPKGQPNATFAGLGIGSYLPEA
jgi:hypothetical protein